VYHGGLNGSLVYHIHFLKMYVKINMGKTFIYFLGDNDLVVMILFITLTLITKFCMKQHRKYGPACLF